MQHLLIKSSGEKHLKKIIINFTKDGNFKRFNNQVKKYLLKNKKKKIVQIIDYVYPLKSLTRTSYEIADHINLSTYNPLIGPKFISLTNVYHSKDGIIVCGLIDGVHPSTLERKILEAARVKAYCYNLVPTVIYAASLGYKVKGFGVVNL